MSETFHSVRNKDDDARIVVGRNPPIYKEFPDDITNIFVNNTSVSLKKDPPPLKPSGFGALFFLRPKTTTLISYEKGIKIRMTFIE